MSSGQNPELRSSLTDVFTAVHLEGKIEDALAWCEENGAWEVSELVTEDIFPDFTKDIGLKKLEVKRLKAALEKTLPPQAQLDITSSSGSYRESSSPVCAPDQRLFNYGFPHGHHNIMVKNTFIEPALSHPTIPLNASRANTWANPGCVMPAMRVQDIGGHQEDDEEDDDDPDDPDSGQGNNSSPSTSIRTPANLGEKTTTYDSFEHGDKLEDGYVQHQAPSIQGMPFDPALVDSSAVLAPFSPMMMGGMPMMPYGMPMMMDPSCYFMPENFPMPVPVSEPKPKAPVLERVFSVASQCERIRWTVDGRKLKTSDREAVSPQFNVSCGGEADCKFKMVLKPKAMDTSRGGACFKKSRGKGYIILRCTSETEQEDHSFKPTLTFRLCIKSAKREELFRGPVRNNFADRAMCGLPEGQDEWDFNKVVDKESNTFVVVLELLKDDS